MRWSWAVVGVLAGCATGKAPRSPPSSQAAPLHLPAASGEQVAAEDLNHDGRPDLWEYTVAAVGADGQPARRRTREELDVNRDGRPDVARWFDARQRVAREALDLDFDGRVDRVQRYEEGRLVREASGAAP